MTTSPGQVAGATQQAAGQTASTAKDEAVQVGHTAASAASDVAGTAKQQAGQVAGEAVNQLRQLTGDAKSQASQQAANATQKLSDTVRSLAGEVRDLSSGKGEPSGTVAGLAQQLADKGEQLAEYIAGQGPGGLVQELRSFASRRPGTFLLAALGAGLATGRVVRGATAGDSSTSGPSPAAMPPPVLTAAPPAVAYEVDVTPVTGSGVGAVPVHSDDSGVLDAGVDSIGPVSGDERLRAEGQSRTPHEPGTGLR